MEGNKLRRRAESWADMTDMTDEMLAVTQEEVTGGIACCQVTSDLTKEMEAMTQEEDTGGIALPKDIMFRCQATLCSFTSVTPLSMKITVQSALQAQDLSQRSFNRSERPLTCPNMLVIFWSKRAV